MIKMVVVDIDGTILSNKNGISQNLKNHVQELIKNNIKVVIATGRMYSSASQIAKELGTNTPVISYQGGLIIDPNNNQTLWAKYFDEPNARDVITRLREEKVHINIYIDDKLIVEKESVELIDYAQSKFIDYEIVKTFDDLSFDKLNKVLAIDYNPHKIDYLVEKMSTVYKDKLYVVKSTQQFCEFSNPDATKGNGIRYLANKWNIKQEEIMAIGDQDNDIEMLLAAGVRVAMDNATDNLKKVSNFITKSVDEDGVVHAINEFIGIKV